MILINDFKLNNLLGITQILRGYVNVRHVISVGGVPPHWGPMWGVHY